MLIMHRRVWRMDIQTFKMSLDHAPLIVQSLYRHRFIDRWPRPYTHRHTHTCTHTQTQTHMITNTHTNTNTSKHRQTHTDTDPYTYTDTDITYCNHFIDDLSAWPLASHRDTTPFGAPHRDTTPFGVYTSFIRQSTRLFRTYTFFDKHHWYKIYVWKTFAKKS